MERSLENVISISTVDEAIEAIKELYRKDSVSMCDFMSTLEIHGLTIEEVVTVFARLMKYSDDDLLITVKDGEASVIK